MGDGLAPAGTFFISVTSLPALACRAGLDPHRLPGARAKPPAEDGGERQHEAELRIPRADHTALEREREQPAQRQPQQPGQQRLGQKRPARIAGTNDAPAFLGSSLGTSIVERTGDRLQMCSRLLMAARLESRGIQPAGR